MPSYARGELTSDDSMTTVEGDGVRTEVVLKESQSAAVVRLPITIESASPMNRKAP
jgi:hypothetical protein